MPVVQSHYQHYQQAGPVARDLPIDKNQQYASVFFFAIGTSPALLSVFSSESLGPMVHDSAILHETVSSVGGFYALSAPHMLTFNGTERNALLGKWKSLRTLIAHEFEELGTSDMSNEIITCGALLSFVEVIVASIALPNLNTD